MRKKSIIQFSIKKIVKADEESSLTWIDGDVLSRGLSGKIGLYLKEDGTPVLSEQDWNIDQDLKNLGLNPDSTRALGLVEDWIQFVRGQGVVS